ncbi:16926_t:CDS:1 [Funneliformis mosseae]|uniref:16926_t:CDS:1 n=1 Tax=Funneliformis mosseae TaxID=27381 RepID=A0A9N9HB80_FUNMO|nr:16926_t:CDS:1 [Funneliformis mosseae]
MTTPHLPDDCIYYILKHLQNNHSTLFECLLVNRFWCKVTVPLLYVSPFETIDKRHNYSIIMTLITCLNKAEIVQLRNQLNFINVQNIKINIEYKPLFDYTKYIEIYNDTIINLIIFNWFNRHLNLIDYQRKGMLDNFISTFHQSMLNQCVNIKQLNISLIQFEKENFNIQFIKNFSSNLLKLTCLNLKNFNEINNEVVLEFLNSIENNCLNLKKLELSLYKSYPLETLAGKLCSIIQQQQHLNIIKLSHCDFILDDIFLSLEFQRFSLTYFEFSYTNFSHASFKDFIDLSNLKYLKFYGCKEISLENCEILKFASFNLKELILQYNSWKSNITISMIKYLGISLQRLLVSDKTTIQIIQTISNYCLNLSTLEIKIETNTDISIFPYLKNLNIKILNIQIFINNNNMGDWFISLANSLPSSVEEISFHSITLFHSSYFKILLDNCHGYLVTINLNDYINLYNLKAVLDYAERSNHHLRLLGIRMIGTRLNEEESQLLNKIKEKEVNVMEFNSIYKETDYVYL